MRVPVEEIAELTDAFDTLDEEERLSLAVSIAMNRHSPTVATVFSVVFGFVGGDRIYLRQPELAAAKALMTVVAALAVLTTQASGVEIWPAPSSFAAWAALTSLTVWVAWMVRDWFTIRHETTACNVHLIHKISLALITGRHDPVSCPEGPQTEPVSEQPG